MCPRRVRAIVVALTASAVVFLAASPAAALKPQFERTKPHVAAYISLGVLADGALEAEGAHGSLWLPPDVAPPSQRAWQLSDDPAPMVDGRVERGRLFIDRVTAYFDPARDGARGEPARDPGAAMVVVEPAEPGEPCSLGRGIPATAQISYESGDGRVEDLTEPIHVACSDYGDDRVINAADFVIWRTDH